MDEYIGKPTKGDRRINKDLRHYFRSSVQSSAKQTPSNDQKIVNSDEGIMYTTYSKISWYLILALRFK